MSISSYRQTYLPPISRDCFSRNLERKNISLVFVGENHTDPAPVGLARKYIKQFHSLAIPQVRCVELPFDCSFEEHALNIDDWVKMNEIFLGLDSFKNMVIHDDLLTFPYFTSEQDEKIGQIISEIFPHFNDELHQKSTHFLLRHLSLQEISLLNKQLVELNIPYQGIERSKAEHFELGKQLKNDPSILFEYEEIRIDAMTQNIFNKALPQIEETGGIIWLAIGLGHSANLAGSIYKHIIENRLSEQYAFNLIPTVCYSSYVSFDIDFLLKSIVLSAKYFKNKELLSTIKKMPLYEVQISEIGMHHYESLLFDQLMQKVESFHSTKFHE